MDTEQLFQSLWDRDEDFVFSKNEPEGRPICAHAQEFETWAQVLLEKSTHEKNIVVLNQAKVLLVDKYFEWRSVVSRNHRNRVGATSHRCIFHVFEDTYGTLKAAELALTPPMLFVPLPPLPPPPPPPLPQIAGVFLGELDKP